MKKKVKVIVTMGLLLAIGYLLPLATGNIPTIGRMLNPMHIPVLIAGMFLGPIYGLILGFILPITRGLIFATPVFPYSLVMSFELASYGLFSGLLLKVLKKENIISLYISLVLSLLIGRAIWGIGRYILGLLIEEPFTFKMFLTIGYATSYPGIILQLILIPPLIKALKKYNKED